VTARLALGQLGALVWKDLLLEYRTRELLTAMGLFGLLALLVFNFALDLQLDNTQALMPGVLWVGIAFAGTLGLGRSFVQEHDRGSLDGLLLAPVDRGLIYLAKVLANVLFMFGAEAALLAALGILFNVHVLQPGILVPLGLGTVGLAGAGTLFAAVAANTRAREVMLPVLLFPLITPVVIGAVQATAVGLFGAPLQGTPPWTALLLAYDVVVLVLSYMVFEIVLEE
jgi:heme exporter protein B